jgi:hypothetical protein
VCSLKRRAAYPRRSFRKKENGAHGYMGTQPSKPQASDASTTASATPATALVDTEVYYAIRLEPEQSVQLYGLWMPKRTLTWRDVLQNERIHLSACIACGLKPEKLCKLQPDIKEWIRFNKATVADCVHMTPWRPHPFRDLGCKSIGELILYRDTMPPSLLLDSQVTFAELRKRYGLTPDLMLMLRYSIDDWIALGLNAEFLHTVTQAQWPRLFGALSRPELESLIERHAKHPPPQTPASRRER